ncbi:hypothetical protein Ple7327_2937 [Pleurocapsa sp. PCC 7327]|nr:hypothetical protein Ple7327_2937 [Pleurocapsa sp. PCC 7327]
MIFKKGICLGKLSQYYTNLKIVANSLKINHGQEFIQLSIIQPQKILRLG